MYKKSNIWKENDKIFQNIVVIQKANLKNMNFLDIMHNSYFKIPNTLSGCFMDDILCLFFFYKGIHFLFNSVILYKEHYTEW